jgi:hypothetical protein
VGFDLYVERPDEAVVERVDALRERSREASARRDAIGQGHDREQLNGWLSEPYDPWNDGQAKLKPDAPDWVVEYWETQLECSRLFDEAYAADLNYFRLNIWGMGTMRQILDRTGVLVWDGEPAWPQVEELASALGVSEQTLQEGGLDEDEQLRERYDALVDESVRGVQPQAGYVYGWKLCDNSGWLVTPAECLAIAAGIGRLTIGDLMLAIDTSEASRTSFEQRMADIFTQLAENTPESVAVAEKIGLEGPITMLAVDKVPDGTDQELVRWAETCLRFASFNQAAAERGGYRVW